MYLDRSTPGPPKAARARPEAGLHFEAFDEAWKQGDDKWGLFNAKDRRARYAIQAINAAGTVFGTATWTYAPSDPGQRRQQRRRSTPKPTPYFQPPVVNARSPPPATRSVRRARGQRRRCSPPACAGTVRRPSPRATGEVATTYGPGDATHSLQISPTPASYGWGLLRQSGQRHDREPLRLPPAARSTSWSAPPTPARSRSASPPTPGSRAAGGHLQLGAGDYGYCTTGAWCSVSIAEGLRGGEPEAGPLAGAPLRHRRPLRPHRQAQGRASRRALPRRHPLVEVTPRGILRSPGDA